MTEASARALIVAALLLASCGDDDQADATTKADGDAETQFGSEDDTGPAIDDGPDSATLAHRFDPRELGPYQETLPCVQWTLDNETALYVQGLTFANRGYFHHSNWFVVPEDLYVGEDGYFDCAARGFEELAAGTIGTVLFAASTQALVEEQRTAQGAVIKIPPRHKVIGGLHMLNAGPDTVTTEATMTLELTHAKHVQTVLTPLRASYLDLDIPAQTRSEFTGECENLGLRILEVTGAPIDIELHYLLPHFHGLGDHFDLRAHGGPLDGQELFAVDGFSGEQLGRVFDPPLSLAGLDSLDFTCGYDNWRDVDVGWGVGDQEMCAMLGLVDSEVIVELSVTTGTIATGTNEDGVVTFAGPCAILTLPKNPAQAPPTQAERESPLEVPASGDDELPPVPPCVDHDEAVAPKLEPTLANVADAVFTPSCSFSSCHGAAGQAAGLNLQAADLLTELLDHEVLGDPGAALVEPGDPASSWLYQLVSTCEPQTGAGESVAHMPSNAPFLLDDRSVALVREWIAAGAPG